MPETAALLPYTPPLEALDDPDLRTADCLTFYRKLTAGVTIVTAGTEGGPVGHRQLRNLGVAAPTAAAGLPGRQSRTMTAIHPHTGPHPRLPA